MCVRASASSLVFFFFFFQAEDGIRDVAVTGVQTCALPISAAQATLGNNFLWAVVVFAATLGLVYLAWRWLNKRSEEHTSELQSRLHLVCRLLLEKKKETTTLRSMMVLTLPYISRHSFSRPP